MDRAGPSHRLVAGKARYINHAYGGLELLVAARDGPGGRATLSGAVGPIHHSGSTARDDPPQWITQRYAYPRPRQSRETGISVVRPAKGYTEGRRTALIHSEWNGRRVETSHCSGIFRHARECGTRRDQTSVGGRARRPRGSGCMPSRLRYGPAPGRAGPTLVGSGFLTCGSSVHNSMVHSEWTVCVPVGATQSGSTCGMCIRPSPGVAVGA